MITQTVSPVALIEGREQIPVPVRQLLLSLFPRQYWLACTETMPITSRNSDPFDSKGDASAIV
jgi:hypothetical protein